MGDTDFVQGFQGSKEWINQDGDFTGCSPVHESEGYTEIRRFSTLFPDFRGRYNRASSLIQLWPWKYFWGTTQNNGQIARRNAEKREQYEMDRKASVEDTLKGHCRMREYYHRRIERLRSRIAALEEQDVATSSPVAAMENQESTRDVGGFGQA
ncbi:uncharacterized protein [Coffea arabica]|uniref:Uncharacterized protein isoform X2 n=1 Tax=Coffea arabica TaxID=13443 RepID=A0ABM4W076_COFAR